MRTTRRKFALRTWFLLCTLPGLGLLTVAYAVLTYRGLRTTILEGFDRMLTAVCTTTAAFIDPADHRRLMEPPHFGGLVSDDAAGGLWSADLAQSRLVHIDSGTGIATWTDIALPQDFSVVASGQDPDHLLVVDGGTGVIRSFDLGTRELAPFSAFEPPLHTLASAPAEGWLFIAGRDFLRYDWSTAQTTVLADLPFAPRDLTYDTERGVLWALDQTGNNLVEIDPITGEIKSRQTLNYDPDQPADHINPSEQVRLTALDWDHQTGQLFATSHSLFLIDRDTGYVSTGERLPAFGHELAPIYLRYVAPMRNLHATVGTRYLYTQVVYDRANLRYGLDASIGEDHTSLLAVDVVPDELVEPVHELQTTGKVYVSDVLEWDQWGLLKTAFAPIRDPESDAVVAMAGADIDISAIETTTHRALVVTIGAGVLLMVLAGVFSLGIVRRITAPLDIIRQAAMQAAAGNYAQTVAVASPLELQRVARAFTQSTSQLNALIASLGAAIRERQQRQNRNALQSRLQELGGASGQHGAWAWGPSAGLHSLDALCHGAIPDGAAMIAWFRPADPGTRPAETAQRRAVLAETARALRARHAADPADLGAALAQVSPDTTWLQLTQHGTDSLGTSSPVRWFEARLGDRDQARVWISPPPAQPLPEPAERTAASAYLRSLQTALPSGHFILVHLPA